MKHVLKVMSLLILTVCSAQPLKTLMPTDNLIVYGEGFSFGVKEPQGWKGDIDNAAKYQANIIFYKSTADLENGGALIQAYAFSKQDENTIEDLDFDVAAYKKEYPKLKIQQFEAAHSGYKTFSKLVYVDHKFWQYITYINPGTSFRKGVSVAMNISNRAATEQELAAYREVVSSLLMISGK